MTPIKYIGHRDNYTEGVYGSGLVFAKGETKHLADDALAKKLLRHPDVYVLAAEQEDKDIADSLEAGDATVSSEETEVVEAVEKKTEEDSEESLQEARDLINTLDKDGLSSYAKTHFSVDVDKRKGVDTLRSQVTGLVDQYGINS